MCKLNIEKLNELRKYYQDMTGVYTPHPEWVKGYCIAVRDVNVLIEK